MQRGSHHAGHLARPWREGQQRAEALHPDVVLPTIAWSAAPKEKGEDGSEHTHTCPPRRLAPVSLSVTEQELNNLLLVHAVLG